jgi:hypothetical protein
MRQTRLKGVDCLYLTQNGENCWLFSNSDEILVYQYGETNVMHILFSLLRIKGLYMFRALLAHPQQALHKRNLVYCVRVMSVGCPRIGTSHKPYRSHAFLLPCLSAKGLDCVFLIWFTQCGHVWFTQTMPFPCHATTMPFWKRPLKATAGSRQDRGRGTDWEWHGMYELASENGRVVEGSRQGNGIGAAWYVWISL